MLLPYNNQPFSQENYNILKLTNSICTVKSTYLPRKSKGETTSKLKVLAIAIQPSISHLTVTNLQGPSKGPLKDTRKYTQSTTNKTSTPWLKHPTSATTSWKAIKNSQVAWGTSLRATSASKTNRQIKSSPTCSRNTSREKKTTKLKCWEHSQE